MRLSMLDIYKSVKHIQRLLWKDDDLIGQETLFKLQEYVAEFALRVAEQCDRNSGDSDIVQDLAKNFPWLYKIEQED